nr:hypothetical protein [Tanacetum cinerariifolium]
KLPVLKLAETYRAMVQEWYYQCRKLTENMTYEITDWAENKVPKNDKNAQWVVCRVSDHQYQVYDERYNRQVDFRTGTCQCHKWQLSGIPCGHVISITRFTSPPRRSFVGGLVATIDPVELERFSKNKVKRILTYSLGYDESSPTFLYLRKPNCSLDSGHVPLADALEDHNMLLMHAQSHENKLHVFISRVEILPAQR